MKRGLLIISLTFLLSGIGYSASCAAGTLASYIALGSTGCRVGVNQFFDFATVPGTAGASEISTNSVSLAPLGGSSNPGLSVIIRASASANTLLETIFTYRAAGGEYSSDNIALNNSSETGDGGVTDTQNYCLGGTFGPDGVSGCSGTAGALLTVDGVQNNDSISFASTALLAITDDFVVDGGTGGSAQGGKITDQFTAVPEPSIFGLFGIAAAFGAMIRRREAGFKE